MELERRGKKEVAKKEKEIERKMKDVNELAGVDKSINQYCRTTLTIFSDVEGPSGFLHFGFYMESLKGIYLIRRIQSGDWNGFMALDWTVWH